MKYLFLIILSVLTLNSFSQIEEIDDFCHAYDRAMDELEGEKLSKAYPFIEIDSTISSRLSGDLYHKIKIFYEENGKSYPETDWLADSTVHIRKVSFHTSNKTITVFQSFYFDKTGRLIKFVEDASEPEECSTTYFYIENLTALLYQKTVSKRCIAGGPDNETIKSTKLSTDQNEFFLNVLREAKSYKELFRRHYNLLNQK